MSILNTTNIAFIVNADKKRPAFGIRECANPFQVFILPRLFKFSVLTFFNRNFRSHAASICRMLRLVDVRGVPFIPKIEIKKRTKPRAAEINLFISIAEAKCVAL